MEETAASKIPRIFKNFKYIEQKDWNHVEQLLKLTKDGVIVVKTTQTMKDKIIETIEE